MRTDLPSGSLAAIRQSLESRRRGAAKVLTVGDVALADGMVRSSDGHQIPIRTYRAGGPLAPAVLYGHSGAFVLGNRNTDHRQCVELATRAERIAVSVEYRLALEHRYPA